MNTALKNELAKLKLTKRQIARRLLVLGSLIAILAFGIVFYLGTQLGAESRTTSQIDNSSATLGSFQGDEDREYFTTKVAPVFESEFEYNRELLAEELDAFRNFNIKHIPSYLSFTGFETRNESSLGSFENLAEGQKYADITYAHDSVLEYCEIAHVFGSDKKGMDKYKELLSSWRNVKDGDYEKMRSINKEYGLPLSFSIVSIVSFDFVNNSISESEDANAGKIVDSYCGIPESKFDQVASFRDEFDVQKIIHSN